MRSCNFLVEKELKNSIKNAAEQASNNPCGEDPFGAQLRNALNWYAYTLPANFQFDRITMKQVIPKTREVRVTSNNPFKEPKQNHKLIKEVKQGKMILNQPLLYTVKEGDTLSDISFSSTQRKASVRDLRSWNWLTGDMIKPGQKLWLADPKDPLTKEILYILSDSELKRSNPSIDLTKLSKEKIALHGNLFQRQYKVQITLGYGEPLESFLNPELLPANNQFHSAGQMLKGSGMMDHDLSKNNQSNMKSGDFWEREWEQNSSSFLSVLKSNMTNGLSYLDSFVGGGGFGYYNSEKKADYIFKGRKPDELYTENIFDPADLSIVFGKTSNSFATNQFNYSIKQKATPIIAFEFSLDFSKSVDLVKTGVDNYEKVKLMIQKINRGGIDTIQYDTYRNNGFPTTGEYVVKRNSNGQIIDTLKRRPGNTDVFFDY